MMGLGGRVLRFISPMVIELNLLLISLWAVNFSLYKQNHSKFSFFFFEVLLYFDKIQLYLWYDNQIKFLVKLLSLGYREIKILAKSLEYFCSYAIEIKPKLSGFVDTN